MAPEVQPDFSGKVVRVCMAGPDAKWASWSLDEPKFEVQYGRLFLVGKLTDPNPGDSFYGRNWVACVPWELIQFYYVESMVNRQQRKYGAPGCNTIAG
jgi:hypothetical protein